jgi:hypothetical protein
MKINRFEDLECWREARGLTKNLYEFQSAYNHCVKVRKIIDGLIRYLKHHRKGPHKMTTDPDQTPPQPAQPA